MNTAETFAQIPVDAIDESPTNPRRTWDAAKLAELADSIRAHGIIQPVVVRPHPSTTGRHELVAGSRRLRAARLAELATVPAIVRNLDDLAVLEVQVIENAQRDDVHPLEEGLGFRALLRAANDEYSVDELAARLGKSRSFVFQRMKLADLIPKAQEHFLAGYFGVGHAVPLARLSADDQTRALVSYGLYEEMAGDGTSVGVNSVRAFLEWIEWEIHRDLSKAAFDQASHELVPEAGPCTTCTKRSGAQPELFPDVKSGDVCGDGQCFARKVEAHVQQIEAEAAAAGEQLVRVSDGYHQPKKGTLAQHSYRVVKRGMKHCEHLQDAVVTEGDSVGARLKICAKARCSVHGGGVSGTSDPNPEWKERERRQREQNKKARAERRALLDACLPLIEDLGEDELRLVASTLLDRLWHIHKQVVADVLGLDARRSCENQVAEYSGPELARLLIVLAVAPDLEISSWSTAKPKRLLGLSERLGVDVAKVKREARAALGPKRARKKATKKRAAAAT